MRVRLSYCIGGDIENHGALIVNSSSKFSELTGAQVAAGWEVMRVDTANKRVAYKTSDARMETAKHDKRIIAANATPFVPQLAGLDLLGAFTVRTPDDAVGIHAYVEKNNCKRVACVLQQNG